MLKLFPGDGCGNRFLLVEESRMKAAGEMGSDLARRLCADRFDGLLVLGDAKSGGVLPVTIFNRDGSDGGACLNGLRVAARHTGADSGEILMAQQRVAWRSCAAGIELSLPLCVDDLAITEHRDSDGEPWFQVDFWNPHAVFKHKPEHLSLADFAAHVSTRTDLFPHGVNVEVVPELGESDELQMRVLERGVGETEACGSGALAVAVVAWRLGGGELIGVNMAGGRLEIERTDEAQIRLRGAASVGLPLSVHELQQDAPKDLI